jgi:serine/threonine protein phosphatase PrpC
MITGAMLQGSRPYQEDRWISKWIEHGEQPGWLLAVLDGHSGDQAAIQAAAALPDLFRDRLSADLPNTLRQTVAACADLIKEEESGTTLSLVYIPRSLRTAYTAIIGDSPVLIVNPQGEVWIAPEHNARTNLIERRAAQDRGAIYKEGYLMDPATGRGLQMSRALGDRSLAWFLSYEPELFQIPLTPQSVVLLATDGVFDPGHGDISHDIQDAVQTLLAGADAETLLEQRAQRTLDDNATAVVWRGEVNGIGEEKIAAKIKVE